MANYKSKHTGAAIDQGIDNANAALEGLAGKLDANKLPEAINTALAQAKASGEFDGKDGVDGKDGKTPVKGTDYWTEADKAEIVQMVIESLGGNPVFGYVDANNNIIVSGNLADGSYSVKYEMENGSKVDIGNLVLDTNVYYTVTNSLTNCTNSNSATSIAKGESYTATITANDGYELKSVAVTMGGSAVTVTNGVINIASVTGDIVITAVAEEVKVIEPVTETITVTSDMSITVNGDDRANTSEYCATPYIDLSQKPKPCVIKLDGAQWTNASASDTSYIRFCVLNTSGQKIVGGYTHPSYMPDGITMTVNDDDRTDVTVTVTGSNIGKIRFAGRYFWESTNHLDEVKATLTYTPNS